MNSSLFSALRAWREQLGSACVLEQDDFMHRMQDTSGIERCVPAIVCIMNEPSLQQALRIANRFQIAIYPISTGNNWGYGTALPPQTNSVIFDLSKMAQIVDFDAELGVVTVEPGVTQGMLAQFLENGGFPYLVPVTGAGPHCSLLANALERGYGVTPHTDHFSAVTNLKAVLPDGSLYRTALHEAGGEELARLFKWGIGPYSAGLFTQSGFGVVTQVSIVLARRPQCVKTCIFSIRDDALLEPAVLAIREILSKVPGVIGGLNIMNQHRVLSMSAPYPQESLSATERLITPEVLKRLGDNYSIAPWTGFATLYGSDRMVLAAQKEIKKALKSVANRLMFITPERAKFYAKLSQWVPGSRGDGLRSLTSTLNHSLELVMGRPNETALALAYWRSGVKGHPGNLNPARDGCGLTWYAPLVPMRSQDVRRFTDMVHRVTSKYGIEPLITFTTLNDRLFDSTIPLLFDRNNPKEVAAAAACYAELFYSGKAEGWFPYRVGIDAMPDLLKMQQHAPQFHERLRKDLDPHDILSPGRYR